ncbi:MAG: hypothetical protein IPM35_41320 [Myxococcales bacterium]|nr:hypothetical protein [Myxococcales bacterium]
MSAYLGANPAMSRSKLLKLPAQRIKCWTAARDGSRRREWESEKLSIGIIEQELERGGFDYAKLNLTDPACDWLDAQVVASPRFHMVDQAGDTLKFQIPTTIGDKFPIVPLIDREGTAISSPQRAIQTRILALRERLVGQSSSFESDEWFQDLRNLFSECTSLVDVTLHQTYYRAKYNPMTGWAFDAAKLGPPYGRRLVDKLAWVHAITGRHLNAHEDINGFTRIKNLRNHLQHFDPPCFCFTLEDVATWLNDVKATARLAWKIRLAVGSPLSVPLMQILLAPDVRFVPKDNRPRQPQPSTVGYASCKWP